MENDFAKIADNLIKKETGFDVQPQNNSELEGGLTLKDIVSRSGDYPEYTIDTLLEILGLTVKKDDFNKVLVFLCQLLAYSNDSQVNISFNAPSSSGKSYLALEISELFPKEDVIKLGYASPTSFFHTTSEWNEEKKGYIVDLERKIVVFLDMPHSLLLQHLRPLLSHDQKEILVKITDKSKKGGIKTKDIYIIGFPAVLFCTASFQFDEQELTRFILLSPETNQEKLRAAIYEKVKKETDSDLYHSTLETDPKRKALKERILMIRNARINQIKLGNPDKLLAMFYERNKILKPRHSRDIQRISSLTKAFALLNFWHRKLEGEAIITNADDLKNTYKIWDQISLAQELGVAPYIINLYKEVFVPAYESKDKTGITRQDVMKKHYEVYGRHIPDWQLRQEIIPMLEVAGLISQEQDPNDKRKMLLYPLVQIGDSPPLPLTISLEATTVSNGIKKEATTYSLNNVGKERLSSNSLSFVNEEYEETEAEKL